MVDYQYLIYSAVKLCRCAITCETLVG
jgi:hypothetical protein